MAHIIEMNPSTPQPRKMDKVIDALKDGELVAYPTDTVYAIGCDMLNRDAVEKLNKLVAEIKKSPEHSPLAYICHDLKNVAEYAIINNDAHRILRRLLPGPYTFILEATKRIPKTSLKKRKTVGIRVPDSEIPLQMVRQLGNAVLTTSAMIDGELIADPWALKDAYGHAVSVIVDGGYIAPEPSTVLDLSGDYPSVIRMGKGPLLDIEFVL